MRCRTAIESQVSGALLPGFGQHDVEQLRVALYCAERGIEEVINQTNDPGWIDTLPDDIAGRPETASGRAWLLVSEVCIDRTGAPVLHSLDYHRGDIFSFQVLRRRIQHDHVGALHA